MNFIYLTWFRLYTNLRFFNSIVPFRLFRRNRATLVISIFHLRASGIDAFFFFFSTIFKVNFIYLGFVYKPIITLHLFFDESKLAALVTPSIFNFHLNSRHEVLTFRKYIFSFLLKIQFNF